MNQPVLFQKLALFPILIGLTVATFPGQPAAAQMFKPPGAEAPGTSKGGGTRTDTMCMGTTDSKSVIPLLPTTQIGFTTSTHPTLLVYFPPSEIKQVFFSLKDEAGNHYYQTQFAAPQGSGIMPIRFPQEAPDLEVGKNTCGLWLWSAAVNLNPIVLRLPDGLNVEPPQILMGLSSRLSSRHLPWARQVCGTI
ncbi:MAG: DUF928 domain-containing protein [Oscillatoriales cyanobacterium RM2_1_1]|nr:DUF928 domain-containing protein [Oscillatoriales cyanobacterium RM2_1_1]